MTAERGNNKKYFLGARKSIFGVVLLNFPLKNCHRN